MNKSNGIESSRSWFCVLNNPQNIFGDISPDEMVNKAIEMWVMDKPQRSCGVNYEIGDSGTPHMHMVLEDPSKTRFGYVQKLFKGIHIEPTRGSKEQAMDYITKRGRFEEKNHTVIVPAVIHGEIKAHKGSRNDLDIIQELLDKGMKPDDIMDMSIHYRKYESMIRKQYFRNRIVLTPSVRDVVVFWHVGESGCGKTWSYTKLCEEHGRDSVYLLNDYENGGFDNYCGESILFMDEFKCNMRFQTLLNYLDIYPVQIHCRYANAYALWSEVHISSVFPPEEAYRNLVSDDMRGKDSYEQLKRRIKYIVYHYKRNGEFLTETVSMSEYTDYNSLVNSVISADDFIPCQLDMDIPFNKGE